MVRRNKAPRTTQTIRRGEPLPPLLAGQRTTLPGTTRPERRNAIRSIKGFFGRLF